MKLVLVALAAATVWINPNIGTIPNVRTSADAIAAAKHLCAKYIPRDTKVYWGADYSKGMARGFLHYKDGWNVDGRYYPKHLPPGVMSVMDILTFIPKQGEPPGCTAISN